LVAKISQRSLGFNGDHCVLPYGTKAAERSSMTYWRFDTFLRLQHPNDVLRLGNRVSALILALALATANGAVCAGWMPTPEARMACCTEDACPMHRSQSNQSAWHHDVTQTQADSCCAASARDEGAQSSPSFVPAVSLVLAPSPVAFVLQQPDKTAPTWQTDVPILRTHVPTHLLLSVLIV
jgi:hypothetical protein